MSGEAVNPKAYPLADAQVSCLAVLSVLVPLNIT